MFIQKTPHLCCLKSLDVWCFKAPSINMLDNIRQPIYTRLRLPYGTELVDKEWNIVLMARD